jgi:hypothetical protein
MKNEPNFETFHQAFSSRIEINGALAGALNASTHDFERFKKACFQFETTISTLGKGDIEDQYRAYHIATSIFSLLAEWKHAIRNAEKDAHRFLNSAQLKASETEICSADERLAIFINQVAAVRSVNDLDVIQDHLKQWSLPLLLFSNLSFEDFSDGLNSAWNRNSEEPEKFETTVAFLKFDIDGEPAQQWNYLKPGTSYDLTIEVRVSHWPKSANYLSLKPVTIDIREKNWLPSFSFEKPKGDGPFILTGTGRAVLEIAHSFGSRPYEFLYAAEFDDTTHCKDVAIIGHRRLLLEGTDVTANPLTGFSNVDRHILSIRDKLRTFPGLHSDDVANAMILLSGLGNIAAQALRDGLFEANTSEKNYQKDATKMLRNRSDIGEHLQGHPAAAGGITDLTFRDIPLELKVENGKALFPKDFKKYFKQTAAYAIGLGKRLGVLSVLESSPKNEPVGIIEDDIEVFTESSGQSQVVIVVAIIRGGFPKPSTYSR